MQELWSKRYNTAVGNALRELLYEPIREGSANNWRFETDVVPIQGS